MELDSARKHVPTTVTVGYAHGKVHGTHAIGRFNAWLAVQITRRVGSMWAAYAFFVLSLISLPAVIATRNPLVIVGWVAQTFLQLVLLPIIMVGQNVSQAASDARSWNDHLTLTALKTINDQQLKILEGQTKEIKLFRQFAQARLEEEKSNGARR